MEIILPKENIKDILKECFIYYSNKIKNPISKFDYTEVTSLKNFSKYLIDNKEYFLNINWIFEYFNYQFCYWNYIKEEKEKKTKEVYKIKLHWILGQKALYRYNHKNRSSSYFYHTIFFPKFNIRREDLIEFLLEKKIISKIKKKSKLNIKEESIKKIKYNTIEGFSLCINFTTLFTFKSDLCNNCKFKLNCKKILKNNYPKIFQKRLIEHTLSKINKNEK